MQLGITFIAAPSPQAKGRIERLWGVLQDRLTSELRLAQACDLDAANRVLARPSENRLAPGSGTSGTHLLLHARAHSSATRTSCNGTDGGCKSIRSRARYSFAGANVQICHVLDGRVSLYYRDTRLEHSNLAGG